jgi:hypothetical protein
MKLIKGLIRQLILEGVEDDYKRKLLNDNPYLGMNEINHYVNEFNKIKNNLPTDKRDITKYDWDNLESVVDSNQSIEKIEKGIIEIDHSDLIYNQNNLKILKANTKNACVKYGTGYGFCISSRGSGNQYYNYRYGGRYTQEEKSIYFVIDENKTKDIKTQNPLRFVDPTHMLVIMVKKVINNNGIQLPDGTFILNPANYNRPIPSLFYQVTTANNDGDENMSWEQIVKLQPKLGDLQKLFQPLKPNAKEKLLYNTKKEFNKRIIEWREENEELFENYNRNDLELYFGDSDASIQFYTNDVDTLEFNYKLLRKIKELSIGNKLQVLEFNGTNYVDHITLLTPLFNNISKTNGLEYYVFEYITNLNLKDGFNVEPNNPIIRKDSIIVDGDINDSSMFKFYLSQYARFKHKFNIERSWVELDEDFYRYANEIEKLYKEYINDINYTLSTL